MKTAFPKRPISFDIFCICFVSSIVGIMIYTIAISISSETVNTQVTKRNREFFKNIGDLSISPLVTYQEEYDKKFPENSNNTILESVESTIETTEQQVTPFKNLQYQSPAPQPRQHNKVKEILKILSQTWGWREAETHLKYLRESGYKLTPTESTILISVISIKWGKDDLWPADYESLHNMLITVSMMSE